MDVLPNPVDLRAIFGMPPKDAIDYLRGKGYAITWNWHDIEAAAHQRAFTVAKMTSADLLRDVRNALTDNFAQGKTVEDFLRDMQPWLESQGWWGKQIVVDSKALADKYNDPEGSKAELQDFLDNMTGKHILYETKFIEPTQSFEENYVNLQSIKFDIVTEDDEKENEE